eukprot:3071608-Lingulodinium_polyedra.AAC.1
MALIVRDSGSYKSRGRCPSSAGANAWPLSTNIKIVIIMHSCTTAATPAKKKTCCSTPLCVPRALKFDDGQPPFNYWGGCVNRRCLHTGA